MTFSVVSFKINQKSDKETLCVYGFLPAEKNAPSNYISLYICDIDDSKDIEQKLISAFIDNLFLDLHFKRASLEEPNVKSIEQRDSTMIIIVNSADLILVERTKINAKI